MIFRFCTLPSLERHQSSAGILSYMFGVFNKDDFVVVVGSTLNKGGRKSDYQFEICKVLEVCKYELVVDGVTSSFRRAFKVSKNNCFRINLSAVKTHTPKRKPQIGDLVMYYHAGYDKTEKQVGLLMNIIDNPGGTTLGKIMSGNKVEDVSYKDLMILEENCKNAISKIK